MIKSIKLLNTYGIRETFVDFKLKNIFKNNNFDQSDQVIIDGNDYYALVPTFLSKNAVGKTSFIKAAEMITRFIDREALKNIMVSKAFRLSVDSWSSSFIDIEQSLDLKLDDNNDDLAKKEISRMFFEVIHNGQEEFEIQIELKNHDAYSIHGNVDDIIIYKNGRESDSISLYNLLSKMIVEFKDGERPTGKKTAIKFDEFFEGIDFPFLKNFKFSAIHGNGESHKTNNAKSAASGQIISLYKRFGFEFINSLLTKVDQNISHMEENIETGVILIFRKDSDFPMSADNLSWGTKKLIYILYKSIAIFDNGGALLIDEIENGLHLSLIKLIVKLFSNDEINDKQAQLIITTHNPLLGERGVISSRNILMNENEDFLSINKIRKNHKLPIDSYILSKNYYNDIFWKREGLEPKSTLSDMQIDMIISKLEEHHA